MSSIAHLRRNPTTKTVILIGTGVVGAAALVYFLWPSEEAAATEEEKREPALAFGPGKDNKGTGAGQFTLDTSNPVVQAWLTDTDTGRVENPLFLLKNGTQIRVTRADAAAAVSGGSAYYLGAMRASIAEGKKPKSSGKGLSFRPKSDAERALDEFNSLMAANGVKT